MPTFTATIEIQIDANHKLSAHVFADEIASMVRKVKRCKAVTTTVKINPEILTKQKTT